MQFLRGLLETVTENIEGAGVALLTINRVDDRLREIFFGDVEVVFVIARTI